MTGHRSAAQSPYRISRRLLIELIAGGLLVYVLIAGLAGLGNSLRAMRHVNPGLIAAALLLILCSYIAATVTYLLLAARPIAFMPTFVIQISGCLVNRLLPAGLGGLGINAVYLHRHKHTLALATTVVASNNALGFIGNVILLGITVAFSSLTIEMLHIPRVPIWGVVLLIAIVQCAGIYARRHRHASRSTPPHVHDIAGYFSHLLQHPLRSLGALLSSCAVTVTHTTALYLLLIALHYQGSWPIALVAISAGAFMGAAVPTPGGLGGAEAGIAASLAAFGIASEGAVAASLIYRGITYWLPLIPGYLALRVAEKRYL